MAENLRQVVDIVGDSHTMFFKSDLRILRRIGVNRAIRYMPRVQQVNGASLTGVRKYASTLRLKEIIEEKAKTSSHMVVSLGQVDLELGFYYRQVVKGETWQPADYVEFLADIYKGLLEGIGGTGCQVALKGVNLTVLSTRLFSKRYLSRILTEKSPDTRAEAEAKLTGLMLGEPAQNAFHLAFNARIAGLAAEHGARYFDINDRVAARNPRGVILQPMRLATAHQPIAFDHHLAPTIHVHRAHFDALQAVFQQTGATKAADLHVVDGVGV
ncbi:hypothetical protein [Paracoccus sp. KR1-242]|uniref:hypothetical protein n=1 Tax=Paracoccus sp. KR1-242 TaxID=3410028 RepID=UPI003C0A8153